MHNSIPIRRTSTNSHGILLQSFPSVCSLPPNVSPNFLVLRTLFAWSHEHRFTRTLRHLPSATRSVRNVRSFDDIFHQRSSHCFASTHSLSKCINLRELALRFVEARVFFHNRGVSGRDTFQHPRSWTSANRISFWLERTQQRADLLLPATSSDGMVLLSM